MSRDVRARVENRVAGSQSLSAGDSSGTVALTGGAAPARVILTVANPDGSAIIASVDGDLRADGFDFTLSAEVADGAKLHFLCDY